MSKMTTCLWFDGVAREAADFDASVFPDSHVDARCAPPDDPGGAAGIELTVEFTLPHQSFLGLNAGPQHKLDQSVSFEVFTGTQGETDRAAVARVFEAMMTMRKIDHAAIEAAQWGNV